MLCKPHLINFEGLFSHFVAQKPTMYIQQVLDQTNNNNNNTLIKQLP